MRVVIFGDSHVGALVRGHRQIRDNGKWPADVELLIRGTNGGVFTGEFFVDRGDHVEIVAEKFWGSMKRLPLADDQSRNTVYGICAHYHSARVWRNPQWKHYAPIALARNEHPVSEEMVKRMAVDDQRQMLALAAVLNRIGVRTFAIEAPRPFSDHRALQLLRKDVIQRVDTIYRKAMRDVLDKLSVPTLGLPAECIAPDGFMDGCFKIDRMGDQHHANSKFGMLMMERMLLFLADHFPPNSET